MIEIGPYNTAPSEYVINLGSSIRVISRDATTPSKRVVLALQALNERIVTKGFRQSVLKAIFDDALEQDFGNKAAKDKYVRRMRRWTGKNATHHIVEHCEILNTWRHRDARFVPEAYLLDAERKTVVCYEIEDHHPLNPFSVGEYAAAWWTLEYIYWDLHLIAYDIYGNPRVVSFPESDFTARLERERRRAPVA